MSQKKFAVGDKVVYPSHGVGRIMAEETQEVAGFSTSLYVISFEKEKMTLRVPTKRAAAAGLRPLSEKTILKDAMDTLKSRSKPGRGMWSRRAQEYETKINSGDILSIAEVVRDLHKNVDDPDRSYSERVIYEAALNRLAGEFAAIEGSSHEDATRKLEDILKVKRARAANTNKKAANSDEAEVEAA